MTLPIPFIARGAWGKGQNEGILFLLVVGERRSRLEVGYGLEPILPDGLDGSVLREMQPPLRQGHDGRGRGVRQREQRRFGSSSQVPLMTGFNPGAPPPSSEGFQIITPIVKNVAAAASLEYCTYTNVILKEGAWVNATEGYQTLGGHHIIVFYTTSPQPESTHICSNDEMAEFKFAMPVDKTSSGDQVATRTVLPGNLAAYIPAGAQIVVDHHYLNAGQSTIPEAQSAINVFYAPSGDHTPSGNTVILNSSMTVPVGASSVNINCTVNNTFAIWQMIRTCTSGARTSQSRTPRRPRA